MADLRVVDGRLHFEFLDGISGRLNRHARPRPDVARAVDRELAVDGAADRDAAEIVVVHRTLQRVRTFERRAAHEARQSVGGAISERDFLNQLAVDDLSHGGGTGFEERGVRDDLNFFGDAAGLEHEVDLGPVPDAHLDLVAERLLEALELDRNRVGAGIEVKDRELPSLIGDRGDRGRGCDIGDRDGDTWQHPPGSVFDAARDGTAGVLGAGRRRECEHQDRT